MDLLVIYLQLFLRQQMFTDNEIEIIDEIKPI